MEKGTIVYIGGFELPDKNAAAHRVINNGKILKDLNYNIVYIGISKSNYTENGAQNLNSYYIEYPSKINEWINYLSSIKRVVEIIEEQSNVRAVICYNYQALAFYKLKKYCKLKNIKVIADCTEWYNIKENNFLLQIIKGIDSFIRMRIIQKRVDGLIVISSYLKNYYKNKEIIIIPPLVDIKEKKWNVPVANLRKNGITFVYAGNPGKHKDKLNIIIESLYEIRQHNNYVFYIVGITKEQFIKYYPKLEKKIEKLSEKIEFLGRKSHEETLSILKSADFSMFIRDDNVTTRAGFPTKFVESSSCGIPVITNESSDLKNYIEDGKNGFILDIKSKIDIIKKLEDIITMNLIEISNMKKYSIKSAQTFHYKNYIGKFNTFLKRININ